MRLNSGSSSRKRTPACARLTSPGVGTRPPPTRPASETVWWGARKGRAESSPLPGGSRPATLCIIVATIASSRVRRGMMPGSARASIVFPTPGDPTRSRLCPPAAATSRARFACTWPRISDRSVAPTGAPASGQSGSGISSGVPPDRTRAALLRLRTDRTRSPPRPCASRAFSGGRTIARRPALSAATATGRTPVTPRVVPSSASSPTKATRPRRRGSTWPTAARMPTAIGRSNPAPSFLTSAGARLTVTRSIGNVKPEFLMADATRSRPSRTALSPSPTMEKDGRPRPTSTSTLTTYPSIPSTPPLRAVASIPPPLSLRHMSLNGRP